MRTCNRTLPDGTVCGSTENMLAADICKPCKSRANAIYRANRRLAKLDIDVFHDWSAAEYAYAGWVHSQLLIWSTL